jgi:hypothetical protein
MIETCRSCGRTAAYTCRGTRDMKDANDQICYAALMFAGGGEYTTDRIAAETLLARSGLSKEMEKLTRERDEALAGMDGNTELGANMIARLTREGKEYQAHMEGIVADLRAEVARLREVLNKISVSVDAEKAREIARATLATKEAGDA